MTFLLKESDIPSSRIHHIEDLLFWEGSGGLIKAINALRKASDASSNNLTLKWDGSPAVVIGRKEDGQFFFTDKGGFVAKSYDGKATNKEMLKNMFLSRGKSEKNPKYLKFVENMSNLFPTIEKCLDKNFRGYFSGDLLYFKKPIEINGYYTFKPNVVEYTVDSKSPLGEKMKNSMAGLVIHSSKNLDGSESNVDPKSVFSGNDVLIFPPIRIKQSVQLDKAKMVELLNSVKVCKDKLDLLVDKKTLSDKKISDFPDILYTYINNKVDTGLSGLGKDFFSWLEKNEKLSKNKKENLILHIKSNLNGWECLWKSVTILMDLKDQLVDFLDSQPQDITSNINGTRGGEGYVLSVDKNNQFKFVSRKKFSAANRAVIREGGNVFKHPNGESQTKRIQRSDVSSTVSWLESITQLDIENNLLGSTGKKESSGDIDVAVDEKILSKDELVKILTRWCDSMNENPGEYIKKSGDSVHFKTPISGKESNGFVQTDFMFGDAKWMRWSLAGEPTESKFKGVHRHILLASLAKYRGYKWSYKNGLVDRESGMTITKDPKKISEILFGESDEKSLSSYESIINKIKNNPNFEKMISDARTTLLKYGVDI